MAADDSLLGSGDMSVKGDQNKKILHDLRMNRNGAQRLGWFVNPSTLKTEHESGIESMRNAQKEKRKQHIQATVA